MKIWTWSKYEHVYFPNIWIYILAYLSLVVEIDPGTFKNSHFIYKMCCHAERKNIFRSQYHKSNSSVFHVSFQDAMKHMNATTKRSKRLEGQASTATQHTEQSKVEETGGFVSTCILQVVWSADLHRSPQFHSLLTHSSSRAISGTWIGGTYHI